MSEKLMDAVRSGEIDLEFTKGNEANLKKLAAGRIACYASDRAAAIHTAKKLGPYFEATKFKLREALELSGENTFIAYSMNNNPPYKADFVRKMNEAILAIKKSGEIDTIESAYLR